jgi:signal transduction histidine kinase
VDWTRARVPPRRDLLAALIFAVVWFGGVRLLRGHGWYPLYPQTFTVAGIFTVLVLLTRAPLPRTTLLVVALVYPWAYGRADYGAPLITELHLLPILLIAYTATESGRVSTAWALAGSELPVVLLYTPVSTLRAAVFNRSMKLDLWSWNLSGLGLAMVVTGAVVLLGHAALRQRRTTAQLLERHLELERLRSLETDQVVSAERVRIARELHDVVAHHISAVVIRAQAADRVADAKPEETRAAVRWIAANGQETLAAMRHVVRVLRSTETGGSLAPQATLAELPEIAGRMAAVGLPVELRLPVVTPVLPAAVELATVRIIQEALTNVLVHAEATRAVVELRFGPEDEFRIEVHDDGSAGAPPTVPIRLLTAPLRSASAASAASSPPVPAVAASPLGSDAAVRPEPAGLGGNGLIGMRERAVSCGGELTISSSPLGGWLVTAVLRSTLIGLAR